MEMRWSSKVTHNWAGPVNALLLNSDTQKFKEYRGVVLKLKQLVLLK